MIKSTIEKRRVISLTIHGESGQLELPEFGKNECFVVIERGGSICAYEHRPYVCAKYSYDNVLSSSKAEEIGRYDGSIEDIWEKIIEVTEYNNDYSFDQ